MIKPVIIDNDCRLVSRGTATRIYAHDTGHPRLSPIAPGHDPTDTEWEVRAAHGPHKVSLIKLQDGTLFGTLYHRGILGWQKKSDCHRIARLLQSQLSASSCRTLPPGGSI